MHNMIHDQCVSGQREHILDVYLIADVGLSCTGMATVPYWLPAVTERQERKDMYRKEKKRGVNVRTHTLRSLSSLSFFPNDTSNMATQEKLAMKKKRDSGEEEGTRQRGGGDPTSTRLRGRFISCPTVLDINPQERFFFLPKLKNFQDFLSNSLLKSDG